VTELIREISIRFHVHRDLEPTDALLKALMRTGEAILSIDSLSTLLSLPPRASWANLIADLLKRWGPDWAGQHLFDALATTASPAVWAEVYVDRGRELGVLPDSNSAREQLLSDVDFTEFGTRVLRLIQAAAANGTLEAAPYYYNIITAWKHLDDLEAVRAWIEHGVESSAAFLAKLAKGLLAYTIGSGGRKFYSLSGLPDPQLYDLAKLGTAAGRYLVSSAYSKEDDADRVKALLAGAASMSD